MANVATSDHCSQLNAQSVIASTYYCKASMCTPPDTPGPGPLALSGFFRDIARLLCIHAEGMPMGITRIRPWHVCQKTAATWRAATRRDIARAPLLGGPCTVALIRLTPARLPDATVTDVAHFREMFVTRMGFSDEG